MTGVAEGVVVGVGVGAAVVLGEGKDVVYVAPSASVFSRKIYPS